MFEQDFISDTPKDLFVHRIKDSIGYVNVKNTCDFILFNYPNLVLLELKTTKGISVPFSNLAEHQIKRLAKEEQKDGIKAGFVFNFRKKNLTFFVSACKVKRYTELAKRKSIPISFCEDEGILIRQTLKRTRYKYNLYKLLADLPTENKFKKESGE